MTAATDDFEDFCAATWDRLVAGLAYQFAGDTALAEDLAQEALIRAGARWPQVRQYDSPLAWTFRVSLNLGRSHHRRRAVEKRAKKLLAHPIDRPSPDIERIDVADELNRALGQLPFQQRRIVVARFYLDLTVEEVASAFELTPGAVRSAAHRAVKSLREILPLTSDEY